MHHLPRPGTRLSKSTCTWTCVSHYFKEAVTSVCKLQPRAEMATQAVGYGA